MQKLLEKIRSDELVRAKLRLAFLYMLTTAVLLGLFNILLLHHFNKDLLHFGEEKEISKEEAVQLAEMYHGGSRVVNVEKERVNKHNYYEVYFSDNTDVMIDVDSGRGVSEKDMPEGPESVFEEYLEDALFVVNIIIILLAGLFSYFFSGLALDPIFRESYRQRRFELGAVSDFQSQLAAIRGMTESLLKKKTVSAKESMAALETVQQDAERLYDLSEDLQELVSEDSGFQRLNFKTVVNRVLKEMKPVAAKKHVTFKTTLKQFHRIGNEKLLEVLVRNLIRHAIRSSHSKGKIIVSLEDNGELTVQDFGIGISPNHLTKIFHPSLTPSKTVAFRPETSSMGLSVVREVARRHDAEVIFSGNVGKGTLFKILF